ncbi:MAG: M15 family metallopeptidase [Syntrophales bacterium]|jgi:hypothetical protein|nr:M15 family metallopeptidase [Syntrophales bacterium]MDD4339298.1 M15 family metallopeptidase [Syntrophales bacterium]HPB70331.1 M15 family metallopeptidase [Syntrophales bacterium]HQP28331.1 M15 family metallopeptidase [Syntrophales bacterium]
MTEPSRPVSPLVDSAMSFPEAVAGAQAPPEALAPLSLVDVRYWAFDGRLHAGQLVVHRDLAADVRAIFGWMQRSRFPVAKVVPIVRYGWSDDASMADNNSSAFNYRFVDGTERLSLHALGRAVDLNPRINPVIYGDGRIAPPGAAYRPGAPGTVYPAHPLMEEFRKRGWTWGGDFKTLKDYHHFEKRG